MTEITMSDDRRRKKGFGRQSKHPLRVDMTPMVDLGFILITFFVMTVELTKPVAFTLNMPKEGGSPTTLGESDALTVLLDENNKIYYYHGKWETALAGQAIIPTSFSEKDGLGKIIREKQQWLDTRDSKEGRNGLMLLIKPAKGASYRTVIDGLDEAIINNIKKYTVLSADAAEREWLAKMQ